MENERNHLGRSAIIIEQNQNELSGKNTICRFKSEAKTGSKSYPTSQLINKSFICLKHNITPTAFDYLREAFGLETSYTFGLTKYYKPEDVDKWFNRFKKLVVRGRHVLQIYPHYVAIGISERTKQIQLYKSNR